MSMREYWYAVLCSCNVFVFFWKQRNTELTKSVWKHSLFLYFLEKFHAGWYFFHKSLIKFTKEAIWVWRFLCEKVVNYELSFLGR